MKGPESIVGKKYPYWFTVDSSLRRNGLQIVSQSSVSRSRVATRADQSGHLGHQSGPGREGWAHGFLRLYSHTHAFACIMDAYILF